MLQLLNLLEGAQLELFHCDEEFHLFSFLRLMKEALPYYGYNWKNLLALRTKYAALERKRLKRTQRGIKEPQAALFTFKKLTSRFWVYSTTASVGVNLKNNR